MNRVSEVANRVQLMSRSSDACRLTVFSLFFHCSSFYLPHFSFRFPLSLPCSPTSAVSPLSLGVNFIKEYEWEWVSEHSGGSQYLINSCRTLTPWRPWQQIITFSWRNQVQLQQHLCALSCCSCNCQKALLVGSWRSWDISLSVPSQISAKTDWQTGSEVRRRRGGGGDEVQRRENRGEPFKHAQRFSK